MKNQVKVDALGTIIGSLLVLVPVVFILSLTGCQTEKTAERFMSAQNDVQTCISRVSLMKERMAANTGKRPQVMFQNEQNALVYLVVEKMAEQSATIMQAQAVNEMALCDDAYIAMIRADGQKTAGITGVVKTGVGVGLGLIGVKILADGITELANPEGAVNGDQYNISGSRVVSNSGNNNSGTGGYGSISASGDGEIFGNAINRDGVQQAGLLNRGNTTQAGDITGYTPASNSGNDAFAGSGDSEEVAPEL